MRSTGYSDCTVTALRGPTGSPGFSLPSPPPLPLQLTLGVDVDVEVDFQPPAAGSATAQLAVDSDDSTLPTQTVRLTAQGTVPPPCDFTAQPSSVSFGAVDVGQSATSNVVVTNHGSSECYITGGGASGDAAFSATMPGIGVLNIFKVMAHNPAILRDWLRLATPLLTGGLVLSPRLPRWTPS